MAEQFAANDIAAVLNRAYRTAGRQEAVTPAEVLNFSRTAELTGGNEIIEVDPEDLHPFGEVFGEDADGTA
jgi:hypothetical protein